MKEEKIIKETKSTELKPYTWDKKWVRPYESFYSIMRNFCKVNVMNGTIAAKVLGMKVSSTSKFSSKLGAIVTYPNCDKEYQKLYTDLLPNGYEQQHVMFGGKFENNVKMINEQLYYCPECMKENYHSTYHQIKGMKKCPFHKILLIKSNIKYNPDSINYFGYDKFDLWKKDFLPCDRREDDSFYKLPDFREFEWIFPVCYNARELQFAYKLFDRNELLNIVGTLSLDSFKSETYINEYEKTYNSYKICRYPFDYSHKDSFLLFKRSRSYKFEESHLNDAILMNIKNMMKEYDFLSDDINSKLRKCNSSDYIVSPNDDFELKASFCWAIVDCYYIHDVFGGHWSEHTQSSNAHHVRENNELCLPVLDNYFNRLTISDDAAVRMWMAKTIIDDAFSYLWKQYKNKAIKDGGMNAFYGYMGIRFPEYYFYINKEEHILNICRFE